MNLYFDNLLASIPGGYDKTTQEVPSLSLSGSGNLVIDGDYLYVSTSTTSTTIDLHNQSASQIAKQFPSGITTTVLQDGMAELLMLPNSALNAQLPVTMEIPQNPLWFHIGVMARNLEEMDRTAQNQAAQLNLPVAVGVLLDWWGASCGVSRLDGELDSLYAQRIKGLKFEPNVNNIAIQQFFQKLGYTTQVTDTEYGEFSVNVNLPTTPPNGFFYSTTSLSDSLAQLKAAGIRVIVNLQGLLQDTVHISDLLSYSFAPYPWVVGSSITAGNFTV